MGSPVRQDDGGPAALKDLPRELMHVLAALAPRAAVRAARACGELWGRFRDDPHLFLPAAREVCADPGRWPSVPPSLAARMPLLASWVPVAVSAADAFCYAASPDGATLAVIYTTNYDAVHLYDTEPFGLRCVTELPALPPYEYYADMTFSPLGDALQVDAIVRSAVVVLGKGVHVAYYLKGQLLTATTLLALTLPGGAGSQTAFQVLDVCGGAAPVTWAHRPAGSVTELYASATYAIVEYTPCRLELLTHEGALLRELALHDVMFHGFATQDGFYALHDTGAWSVWKLATGEHRRLGDGAWQIAVRADGRVAADNNAFICFGAVARPIARAEQIAWAGATFTSRSAACSTAWKPLVERLGEGVTHTFAMDMLWIDMLAASFCLTLAVCHTWLDPGSSASEHLCFGMTVLAAFTLLQHAHAIGAVLRGH